MFGRLLISVDFSPSAGSALATARQQFPDATIQLLHILSPRRIATLYSDTSTSPVNAAEARRTLERDSLEHLQTLAQADEACAVAVGQPAQAILEVAATWQPNLIVMGTHGRTGLAHFLSGVVAEEVVRNAQLPVLVVHEQT